VAASDPEFSTSGITHIRDEFMNRSIAILSLSMMGAMAPLSAFALEDPKVIGETKSADVIQADKARDHIDKTITVELIVKSSKNAEKQTRYYLDSEADYKADNNLAVVITYESAADFEKAGIKDIIAHYSEKTIHVTGKVIRESDQTLIYVTEAKQIKLVEKK